MLYSQAIPPFWPIFNARETVFIPSIALGELYYGVRKSARAQENMAHIDAFAEASSVVACDAETAQQYGAIKNDLRTKGRPLPENDIWIAALARQGELTLVTRDHHFSEIADLPQVA